VLECADTTEPTEETRVQDLKKGVAADRKTHLDKIDEELKQVVPRGLPMIKQVELFTKYRQFVPEEFRDELCPDPGTDVIDEIKGQRNTKRKEQAEAKKGRVQSGKRQVDCNGNGLPLGFHHDYADDPTCSPEFNTHDYIL
jgi:hypothetical protein